jgi:hypothetical protein
MSDYIQVAGIRGTPNRSKNALSMVLDDFYTLCLKDPKDNIGLRKKSNFKYNEIIFKSSDTTIDYLCSDFIRFCLALYKNNPQLGAGNMTIIPKQPIPISEELKQYMREFLPDFYDNRTN